VTREDWDGIGAFLQATWPQRELTDETLDAWYESVEDLDAVEVLTAARAEARTGRDWPPTGGQLRKRVGELSGPRRDWSSGYSLVTRAPFGWIDEAADALAWVRERDPIAAEVIRRWGTREWGMRPASNEATHRAQFRDMYREVSDSAAEAEALVGLPPVSGSGLKQVGETSRRLLDSIRQIEAGS
jgi:hypothetical protein